MTQRLRNSIWALALAIILLIVYALAAYLGIDLPPPPARPDEI